jgi:Ca2+-binding EF-hand superfamily protein
MKTRMKVILATSTVIALGGLALAGTAQARGERGEGFQARHLGQYEEHGAAGHHAGGACDWRKGGYMNRQIEGMLKSFGTDKEGKLTQAEIDAARAKRLAAFDTDHDGKLSLKEYQALWLDAMRPQMVKRFQGLDENGDGAVTVSEFTAPYANVVAQMDRNGDDALSRADLRPTGARLGMNNGHWDEK